MTSLLDALKKLATDGSAESISDSHGSTVPHRTRGQTPTIAAGEPKRHAEPDLLDQGSHRGSSLAEHELGIPRLYLNRPLSVVYQDHPRRDSDAKRPADPSHGSEFGVELYHQSVVSQPMAPTGPEADSAPPAFHAVLPGVPASMDESPVEVLESPFLNREPQADTQLRFETPRDASRSGDPQIGTGDEVDFDAPVLCQRWNEGSIEEVGQTSKSVHAMGGKYFEGLGSPLDETVPTPHPNVDTALAGLGARTAAARTPDQTVMAADIPDLWQIMASNSFDVGPVDDAADQGSYPAHGEFASGPDMSKQTRELDATPAACEPTIPQHVRRDIDNGDSTDGYIKAILRQCCANVEQPESLEKDAAASTPEFPAAARPTSPPEEVSSAIVVSTSVGAPVVPRRVATSRPAKTEFEKLLHTMILDKRQGPQIASLHRRIQQIVPRPGSCGIVAVQRDAHVAEVVGCVGSLHLATGNRVLLVDANPDVRRLTDGFELGHLAGLSDVCTGACPYKAAVHRTSTTGISVMPLGTTMELMASWSAVKSVLREATREYGLVLVDVGHALGESTMPVAEACNRILLHVHLGKTHRETARNVADLFFSNNVTVSGLVVTNIAADGPS